LRSFLHPVSWKWTKTTGNSPEPFSGIERSNGWVLDKPHRSKRVGRPRKGSEGDATRRIIDAAIPIFLADGFEAASVDAIAAAAAASKKTLYAKFSSKADLFEAVCLRLIEEYIPPLEQEAARGGSTADCLHRIALVVLKVGLTPDGSALRRIVAAEAVRFPEFARTLHDFGHVRVAPMVERCLEEGVRRGELAIDDVRFAADYFINVAVLPPMNRAMFGLEQSELTHVKRENLRRTLETFLRSFRVERQEATAAGLSQSFLTRFPSGFHSAEPAAPQPGIRISDGRKASLRPQVRSR